MNLSLDAVILADDSCGAVTSLPKMHDPDRTDIVKEIRL